MSGTIGGVSGLDMTSLYQSLFKKIDSDDNGSISKSEFENSISSLDDSGTSASEADSIFSQIDADGSSGISEKELMDELKQAGERTRANMPPPPPPESGTGNNTKETSLTDDQKKTVDSILSNYDSSNLTTSDVKEINQAFSDAGITFGKSLGDEVESQGFDIGTMMRLDPPNRDGSDATASADDSASATDSTSSAEDSLLAELVQYMNSSASGSSSTQESDLLQQVKSSTGMNDDQINALFDAFLNSLANQSQYDQSGSATYTAAAGSSNLFSIAA